MKTKEYLHSFLNVQKNTQQYAFNILCDYYMKSKNTGGGGDF